MSGGRAKARVNMFEGLNTTYYTVTLEQEDGTAITRTVRDAEEALRVKENWERGTHKFLRESDKP